MKVLVLGGTSGIGKGVADALVARGDEVAVVGLHEGFDILQPGQVDDVLAAIGPQDAYIYCIGKASLQMIGTLSEEVDEVYGANVLGFLKLLNAVTYLQEEGRIIAIASDASRVPMRGSIAYCSSKAALVMAIKCAARELAPNWFIGGVSPSVVKGTQMTEFIDATVPVFRGWTAEQARAYELSGNPMQRRATIEEVVEAVLIQLDAPMFATGSIYDITGGK